MQIGYNTNTCINSHINIDRSTVNVDTITSENYSVVNSVVISRVLCSDCCIKFKLNKTHICCAAAHLGLPYLSSYLDSIDAEFRRGANFAAGGATIRSQNATLFDGGISPFSLGIQTMQFDQFKSRTIDLYHQG